MRQLILAAAISLALGGCVSIGAQVKEEQLAQFEKGKTTLAEVVRSLGQPTSTTLLPSGNRMISYTFVQAQARPESFIPIIGPLVGGTDSRSSMAMLTFDSAGILQSYTASSSQFGSGRGLSAGQSAARVPDQPRQAP